MNREPSIYEGRVICTKLQAAVSSRELAFTPFSSARVFPPIRRVFQSHLCSKTRTSNLSDMQECTRCDPLRSLTPTGVGVWLSPG
ncbi:hypothetical protein OJAV_G00121440 [Oryzias javanicus]|uniref:Uncharacterized protein n=1 Tax=Oryzias javanicus TaxID=123683 RepID=A0A437CUX3_ORYJA|nr:hypothetical protein OJAV_G00121440 [Oryzias javanicus]